MDILHRLHRVIRAAQMVLRRPDRRIWTTDGFPRKRAHIELGVDGDAARFAETLDAGLVKGDGIDWVEIDPGQGRAVVEYDASEVGLEDVVALIDGAEDAAESGTAARRAAEPEESPSRHDRTAPHDRERHHLNANGIEDIPGDADVLRCVVEMAADAIGAALGLALGLVPVPRIPGAPTIAALVSTLKNQATLREPIERRIGVRRTEVGLTMLNSSAQGFAGNILSPLVDLTYRGLLVLEADTRAEQWSRFEDELYAEAPARACTIRGAAAGAARRPDELRDGPIETYRRRALVLGVGAAGFALPITRSVDSASTALAAASPKPAQLGREAFCVALTRRLADHDVHVAGTRALRSLDRIDAAVIDDQLPDGLTMVAEEAGLDVRSVRGGADGGAGLVHELQSAGTGVIMVARAETDGLAAADCGVGVFDSDDRRGGYADLLCSGAAGAELVLRAIPAARRVSGRGVQLAAAGGIAGTGLTIIRLPHGPDPVGLTINGAAWTAMALGWRDARAAELEPEQVGAEHGEESVASAGPAWHRMDVDEVFDALDASPDGLSEAEAAQRRSPRAERPSGPARFGRALYRELANPLTPMLAAGAGLSVLVGSVIDAVMVGGVMGANAVIGGTQRFSAENAVAALDEASTEQVTVLREGDEKDVDTDALAPGDVIVVHAGDIVGADARLFEAEGLEADESSLTGESLPVAKSTEPTDASTLADRSSMLYESSSIAAGEGRAVVCAVGAETEMRSAEALAGAPERTGGVEARLEQLTRSTTPSALIGGLGVIAAGLVRGRPPRDVLSSAISLAVASVPESLPLLATSAQLASARRLADRRALVRNHRGVEALGRVDVLCADKTGTLTEGSLRVVVVSDCETEAELGNGDLGQPHRRVLRDALLATPTGDGRRSLAHPTDQATLDAGTHVGIDGTGGNGWRRVEELPFEPGRSFHATLIEHASERRYAVKGAPDELLPRCSHGVADPSGSAARVELDEARREELNSYVEDLGRRGIRVLAVAERGEAPDGTMEEEDITDMTLVGFVGLADSPRETAAAAVADVERAGVNVIMLTGDHPTTASGIAANVGLDADAPVLTGDDVEDLDDTTLASRLAETSVCARVTPEHKVRLVRALQQSGHVVGMTGDGANDAPAIRLADVGIALGEDATSAARDAADLVVTDDRIETIVDAIVEGRSLWGSLRDAIAILIGGNVGEILFTVGAGLIEGRPPLNARQLLIVNMLTDVVPSLSIALRPHTEDIDSLVEEGPESSLGELLEDALAVRAIATAAGAGACYGIARVTGRRARARTAALVALVGTQLGQTILIRHRDPVVVGAALASGGVLAAIVQTPGLSHLFGCTPLGPIAWSAALASAAGGTALSTVLPSAVTRVRRIAARVGG